LRREHSWQIVGATAAAAALYLLVGAGRYLQFADTVYDNIS